MHQFIRTLISLLPVMLLAACSSGYVGAARELPPDDRARLQLRVLEARESAAALDRLLADHTPALAGESWNESVDDATWELARRTDAVRDAARRLRPPDPDIDDILASFEGARTDLAAVAASAAPPQDPATLRARASLGAALASADRFTRSSALPAVATQSTPGGAAAAEPPPPAPPH